MMIDKILFLIMIFHMILCAYQKNWSAVSCAFVAIVYSVIAIADND